MITFKGDDRFADVEYTGVTYDPEGGALALLVASDPADNCETVILRHVVNFDIIHFSRQNVIHYLDIARLSFAEHHELVELACKEGAMMSLATDPRPNKLLGTVFVPANGAMIFALCGSVEKCTRDGKSVYGVMA